MEIDSDFDSFWAEYPRKIGKLAAARAYGKARSHAAADVILEGLKAYKRTMPREERFRPHPATWLNAGRWMDEFPEHRQVQAQAEAVDWFDDCKARHNLSCNGRYGHWITCEIEKGKAES